MDMVLRPHHGMCFQFFEGKGYSADFTDHMGRVIRELTGDPNRPVTLTLGPDPVCEGCPNNRNGVCDTPEKVRRYDAAVLRLCGLRAGDSLPYQAFAALVEQRILEAGRRDEICGDCCWNAICRKKLEERSNG